MDSPGQWHYQQVLLHRDRRAPLIVDGGWSCSALEMEPCRERLCALLVRLRCTPSCCWSSGSGVEDRQRQSSRIRAHGGGKERGAFAGNDTKASTRQKDEIAATRLNELWLVRTSRQSSLSFSLAVPCSMPLPGASQARPA
jgi:hypothetical protein